MVRSGRDRQAAGTWAAPGLLLLRFTVIPPAGATPVRLTVPEVFIPPGMLETTRLRDNSVGGSIVKSPVAEEPFAVAVMVAWVTEPTAVVLTTKVALLAPGAP